MAIFGIPLEVVTALISVFAGAAVYHLVAVTLQRRAAKKAILIELWWNHEKLEDVEEHLNPGNWDGKIHNRLQTRSFTSAQLETPAFWIDINQLDELMELYEQLEYLNDLRMASLVQGQDLDRDEVHDIVENCQELVGDITPTLRQQWSEIAVPEDFAPIAEIGRAG